MKYKINGITKEFHYTEADYMKELIGIYDQKKSSLVYQKSVEDQAGNKYGSGGNKYSFTCQDIERKAEQAYAEVVKEFYHPTRIE
jgi:hypothetical protein